MDSTTQAIYQLIDSNQVFSGDLGASVASTSAAISGVRAQLASAGASSDQLAGLDDLVARGGPLESLAEHIAIHQTQFTRDCSIFNSYASVQQGLGTTDAEGAANSADDFFGTLTGGSSALLSQLSDQVATLQNAVITSDLSGVGAAISAMTTAGAGIYTMITSEIGNLANAVGDGLAVSQAGSIIAAATNVYLAPLITSVVSSPMLAQVNAVIANNRSSIGLDTITDDSTPVSTDTTPFSD